MERTAAQSRLAGRAIRAPLEGCRDRERIPTVIVPQHEDLAVLLADRIAAVIGEAVRTKDRCVLGLGTVRAAGPSSPRK